ncbi:type VI-A CRISPR-associated RNA-guided ribonuclease Cas13a [Fusobacterium varium]|uniref:type VI-A CRISPR-associated RNA-guided ribonuclease Cas13a n=1 Tax=Fusobacterium varium TaxID=856 RepID=UPI00242DEF89|nr:type VI-A CRISPR-associated RNA-guided ribonuclease Cas13a [Fusobacterium varium]
MKVTKKKGFNIKEVFHEKKELEGILTKKGKNKNFIEEKFRELSILKLNYFIKKPLEKPKKEEKNNSIRREKLHKYFSKIGIVLKNEKIELIKLEKMDVKLKEKIEERDLKPYASEIGIEIFNDIIENSEISLEKLELFKNTLTLHNKQIEKIKHSLKENKAQFKIENNLTTGKGKRNKFYNFYYKLDKINEYEQNIENSFKAIYSEEDINKIKKILENEKLKKSDLFDEYRKIILKNITVISKDGDNYEELKSNIDKIKNLKPLSKAQFFYKYYLEKIKLTDDNIKFCFPYFVETEMKYLLKDLSKNSYRRNKSQNIFKSYESIINLIKNKLKNKLFNYINNLGKIEIYFREENSEKIVESLDLSLIRQNEGFLRNIIGAISSAYFSFRNIVNPIEKDDLLGKKFHDFSYKIDIDECKKMLSVFYGDYFSNFTEEEIRIFLKSLKDSIYIPRNNVIHFGKGKIEDIFEYNNISLRDKIVVTILEKEWNENYIKLKILNKLNSANVFNVLTLEDVKNYLGKVKYNLLGNNVNFVPAFRKIFNKINDYNKGLELNFEVKESTNNVEENEVRNAQIYLLKQVYYNLFLKDFLNNKDNFFNNTVKEVIELNKNAFLSKKTGFYKLKRIEDIEISTPKEYLSVIQSLYMTNVETMSEEDNFFVEYLKTLFMKGFCIYINNNFQFLKEIKYLENRKSIIDEKLIEIKQSKKEIENQIKDINIELEGVVDEIKIINMPDFNLDKNKIFYLFLRLLDSKELNNLKGTIEKAVTLKTNRLYEEKKVINLILLTNEFLPNQKFNDKNLEILRNFIDDKIEDIVDLKKFTNNENIYCDDKNLIEFRSIYNLKKHCLNELLSKVVEKAKYKITKKEMKEYLDLKNKIDDIYIKQKELHQKYEKNPKYFSKNESEQYEEIVKIIHQYNILKNKIELNDINLIQSILLRILHRIAGYTSLWERDLKFKLLTISSEDLEIKNIFDYQEKYKGNKGQICSKYEEYLKNNKKIKKYLPQNSVLLGVKNKPVRNYIAHFNYLPFPEFSLLETLEKLRELMDYDRKLKNAVLKSIKKIFEEYGFNINFNVTLDKKVEISSIFSNEIEHLKNNKNKKIKIKKYNDELCTVLKILLEYKI